MSPRRNRPSRPWRGGRGSRRGEEAARLDAARAQRGEDSVQGWRGERWRVRYLAGTGTVKTYRCPGCDHEIRPGVAHVVVWPVEGLGGDGDRRHWHTSCWQARDRRFPAR